MDSSFFQELPDSEQPYGRLLDLGVHTLSNPELIALVAGDSIGDPEALPAAHRLLKHCRTLRDLARCDVRQLAALEGIGLIRAARVAAAAELGRRVGKEITARHKMDSPEVVCQLLAQDLRALTRESVRVLLLDTKYHLLHIEEISLGSLNESIAHPREIFRPAFIYSAYAMILVHNHPSGDPAPSKSDRLLTRRLVEAGVLLQIVLQEHIIIGGNLRSGKASYYSFKEAGDM